MNMRHAAYLRGAYRLVTYGSASLHMTTAMHHSRGMPVDTVVMRLTGLPFRG